AEVGPRRRGLAVRLRLLAGLHQPGKQRRARGGRTAAAAEAEFLAALLAAPRRPPHAARAADATPGRTAYGPTPGEDPARRQTRPDRRGAAFPQARRRQVPQPLTRRRPSA